MSAWVIQNKSGAYLTFDETFKDAPSDINLKNEILDRRYQYGAIAQGDGKFSSRKMGFTFDLIAKDPKDFRYKFNRVFSFFNIIDAPFYLINLNYNIRAQVVLSSLKPNWKQGLEQLVSIDTNLDLENLSGVWETNTPLQSVNSNLTNGSTFDINVSIESVEASPEFIVTATTACQEFAILNETTGENFRIQEPGLVAGSYVTIDSVTGKCFLNGNEKPLILTAGSFMKFRNGANTLRFQTPLASIVSITTNYRERFAI
jgi:hypothetical protein